MFVMFVMCGGCISCDLLNACVTDECEETFYI